MKDQYFAEEVHIFLVIPRFPFEWRNPPTYLLIVIMQCIAVTYLFYLIAGLIAFGIGSYVFGIRATAEVETGLELLDKILKSKTDQQYSIKTISILVHYHSLLKKLSFPLEFSAPIPFLLNRHKSLKMFFFRSYIDQPEFSHNFCNRYYVRPCSGVHSRFVVQCFWFKSNWFSIELGE